jgi:hypothetical protein
LDRGDPLVEGEEFLDLFGEATFSGVFTPLTRLSASSSRLLAWAQNSFLSYIKTYLRPVQQSYQENTTKSNHFINFCAK